MSNNRRESFPVVGSFNEDSIAKIDAQRTINMYEVKDVEAKKPKILFPWPGIEKKGEFSRGGISRAARIYKNIDYRIVGDTIYAVDTAQIITIIADMVFPTTTGHIGIATNANELIFVDGVKAILWNATTSTLTDVTANLPPNVIPLDVVAFEGYFVLISDGIGTESKFYVSALNDGTDWTAGGSLPAGNFAIVEFKFTELNAIGSVGTYIFLFGKKNSELWYNAGDANFPFRRNNNLFLEHGVLARSSVAEGYRRLFYLSGDEDGVGSVMMVAGENPHTISTRQLDEVIQRMTNPTDADGSVYKINGQIFYQINFTTDSRTFIYNVNTNFWHEAEMLDDTRTITTAFTFLAGNHFCGSYNNANYYQFSENLNDNDGQNIKRTRICRNFNSPNYDRIRIERFWVDMLQGIGQAFTSGIEADPKVFLSISEDGGATYHDFGPASVGKSGARLTRTMWRRLGVRRDTIIKLEMYNEVPYYILGATIDYEVLPQ